MNSLHQYEISERLLDQNNNGNKPIDKYSLRPRSSKRRDDIIHIPIPKSRTSKPKQKPPPLSKYRRKTANARERTRMREINAAFEALRQAVPHLTPIQITGSNEKLTKITTLRLAMKYISALSATLKDSCSSGSSSGSDLGDLFSDCSDLDLLLESDGESFQVHSDLSDHSLTSPDFATDFGERVNFCEQPISPVFSPQTLSFDQLLSELS